MLKHARFNRVFHVGFSLVLVYQSGMITPAEAIFKVRAGKLGRLGRGQCCKAVLFAILTIKITRQYSMCRLSDE